MTIVSLPGSPVHTERRHDTRQRRGPGQEPGRSRSTVRAALAQAPIGEYGLVEASLAWHELRPGGVAGPERAGSARAVTPAARRSHVPIAYTTDEDLAGRLTRVLTGLTWAVIARADPDRAGLLAVEVPSADYHRVVRALMSAYRHARREFGPGSPAPGSPGVAVALWRMALLVNGAESTRAAVHLRTAVPFAAGLLYRAAGTLGVAASIEQCAGAMGVLVCRWADVRRLFILTGGGPAVDRGQVRGTGAGIEMHG